MEEPQPYSRREFLRFMERGALGVAAGGWLASALSFCRGDYAGPNTIRPTKRDRFTVADGLRADVLVREGEIIETSRDLRFGANNDFLAYFPDARGTNRAVLWANHETPQGFFFEQEQRFSFQAKSRAEFDAQRAAVGGSRLALKKIHTENGWLWRVDADAADNFRLDATTRIRLSRPIKGQNFAEGTLGNCAGGVTPWGTVLSCEENHIYYYGDTRWQDGAERRFLHPKAGQRNNWQIFRDNDPDLYGWVVEINMHTGAAVKHPAMGRFFHECATVVPCADGRVAVYGGDDIQGGCLYKFLSRRPRDLSDGALYVANLAPGVEKGRVRGQWELLDISRPQLRGFRTQENVLIHARDAARSVGGTPLDRPEDVEHQADSGALYISLTNNSRKNPPNPFGSILKILEKQRDPRALEFEAETFLAGGSHHGFACPDNLAFDPRGNLWMTTDMSEESLRTQEFARFGNNGLFYIPMSGPHAGNVYQIAAGPVECELTGPCFAPDGRTLFVSVQHPGITSAYPDKLTSRWPDGDRPRSAVVTIAGPLLDRIAGV